jgi:solute carrier family 25 phosphate transporter 3
MMKFTVFDLSTERLNEAFPAANEDLKLSLLITLVGGILGGIAAAVVSNPADATISEMKKAKSDIGPRDALAVMLDREGIASLFKGLPLRMVFYSMVASLQFVVYDSVRFALGIGPDDLKLYLDVLGGALNAQGGPL